MKEFNKLKKLINIKKYYILINNNNIINKNDFKELLDKKYSERKVNKIIYLIIKINN